MPGSGDSTTARYVYRSSRHNMQVRAGKGGPELTFHSLNGPIRLYTKGI
jgi:hypothetical protein